MDNSHTYVLNPTAMAQLRACPRFWSVSLSVQFSAPQLLPVSWGGVVLSVTRDARPRSIKSDLEHGLCASLCFLHCALFSSHFQTVSNGEALFHARDGDFLPQGDGSPRPCPLSQCPRKQVAQQMPYPNFTLLFGVD